MLLSIKPKLTKLNIKTATPTHHILRSKLGLPLQLSPNLMSIEKLISSVTLKYRSANFELSSVE